MPYGSDSAAGRLLAGDRETVSEAVRWISRVLGSPNFWSLRRDWADMVQEVLGRVIASLRDGPDLPDETARGSSEDRLTAAQLARYVLDRASDSCRELLVAYFMEQRNYSEIAEETGQPVGTVKSRVFRCLDAARVAVGGRGAAKGE